MYRQVRRRKKFIADVVNSILQFRLFWKSENINLYLYINKHVQVMYGEVFTINS